MDRLLGGGLPLGALTLILEDGWSQHHLTLLRYFLGEGSACNQRALVVASTEPEGGISSFLPKLLDPVAAEKEREAKKKEKEEDAVQLKIAWQYGRYLKADGTSGSGWSGGGGGGGIGSISSTSAAGGGGGGSGSQLQSTEYRQQPRNSLQNRPTGREWCHAFDLSKPAVSSGGSGSGIQSEGNAPLAAVELVLCGGSNMKTTSSGVIDAEEPREKLITSVAAFIAAPSGAASQPPTPHKSTSVSRVAVISLGDAAWNLGKNGLGSPDARRTAIQSLIQLKAVVRDTKSCAMVTIPSALYTKSDIRRMSHIADIVLSLEAVQDDADIVRLAPDPSSVAGLLHVQKLCSIGSIAAPAPQNPLYLVRSKRRRMAITPVEIDPDAEESDGAAGVGAGLTGGGSGRTPASALLCGGPAKGKPDLDF